MIPWLIFNTSVNQNRLDANVQKGELVPRGWLQLPCDLWRQTVSGTTDLVRRVRLLRRLRRAEVADPRSCCHCAAFAEILSQTPIDISTSTSVTTGVNLAIDRRRTPELTTQRTATQLPQRNGERVFWLRSINSWSNRPQRQQGSRNRQCFG